LAAGAPLGATPKLHGNNFWSNCRFSHSAGDDPIVVPRHPGWSHRHTFFGNVSTNAYSTLARLRHASTTCKPSADTAAYWVPTLFQNGREVRPAKAQLYYVVFGYGQMRAFPPGLRMIAGDAHAGAPQSSLLTYWDCAGGLGDPLEAVRRAAGAMRDAGASDLSDGTFRAGSLSALPRWSRRASYVQPQRIAGMKQSSGWLSASRSNWRFCVG
jgi:hypothetical protein